MEGGGPEFQEAAFDAHTLSTLTRYGAGLVPDLVECIRGVGNEFSTETPLKFKFNIPC